MTSERNSKFQMTTMSIENIIICFIIASIFPLKTTSNTIGIAELVGCTVSLSCLNSSSDDVIWVFNRDTLYNGREFRGAQFRGRSKFKIDVATGKKILKISGLKPEDAGLYTCRTPSSVTPLQSTQLKVLDSGRTCDSIITDDGLVFSSACPLMQDYMHLPCAVKCYCSKVPRLECKDVNNTQILTDLKCDESQLNRTSCNLTLKATEPQYDGSGTRCSVSTPHGEKHSCITKSITVHYYPPPEEKPTLMTSHKPIGDEIRCSVECNLKLNFLQKGLHYCNVPYSLNDASCWALVSVVHTGSSSGTINELAIIILLIVFIIHCVGCVGGV